MDMDISMDIHRKSVDMDMDGKFHIHGNPAYYASIARQNTLLTVLKRSYFMTVIDGVLRYDTIRYIICTEKLTGKLPV